MQLLPYILFEKYINISALEMASPVNRNCVTCIGTLSFPMCLESVNTGFLYLVYWQWINYPKGGRAGSTVLWLMCQHSACIRGTVAFIAAYMDTLIGMFFLKMMGKIETGDWRTASPVEIVFIFCRFWCWCYLHILYCIVMYGICCVWCSVIEIWYWQL